MGQVNTATIKASAARASFDTLEAMLTRAWPVVVASIFALQTALILIHQPFADEWQAVQIAVQSPDIPALFANLRYETHPPAWYLLLRALAAVVGPYNALPAASLLLALPVQAIILLRSPWPHWALLAVALSAPILFEFSVVARGHTLGMALIFAALATWERKAIPWFAIAVLPAVDFLYGVVSLALIAFRFAERRIWLPGLGAWLAISLIAAWSIIPAPDYVPVYGESDGRFMHLALALFRFSVVYLPVQGDFDALDWGTGPPELLMRTLWSVLVLTMAVLARGRRLEGAVMFGIMALMFAFSAWLYPLQNRHVFLLGTVMLVVLWRRSAAGEPVHPVVGLWLAFGAFAGLWTAWFGLTHTFERSREIAQYIRAEGLADEHWVAVPDMAGQGISALTQVPFEKPGGGCMQSYVRWDAPLAMRRPEGYMPWLRHQVPERGRFYIFSNKAIEGLPAVQPVKSWAPVLEAKEYHIYVVNPDAAPARLALPNCVPGTRPLAAKPAI